VFQAFSPTGEYLVERMGASSVIGDVAIFDPVSRQEHVIVQGLNSFGFSNDGKWIGLQGVDPTSGYQTILLVSAAGGEPRLVFQGTAMYPSFASDSPRILMMSRSAPPQFSSIQINGGLGGPPEPYVSPVLLQTFTEFGADAIMDFDIARQRALVNVNESDMDIVRRKANP
jgi:hypothetical protein